MTPRERDGSARPRDRTRHSRSYRSRGQHSDHSHESRSGRHGGSRETDRPKRSREGVANELYYLDPIHSGDVLAGDGRREAHSQYSESKKRSMNGDSEGGVTNDARHHGRRGGTDSESSGDSRRPARRKMPREGSYEGREEGKFVPRSEVHVSAEEGMHEDRVDSIAKVATPEDKRNTSAGNDASEDKEFLSTSEAMPEERRHPPDDPSPENELHAASDTPLPPSLRPRDTRASHPRLHSCRSVYKYTKLNHIEEGTYGIVFRARCNETGDIVALKKIKMDKERSGFPITSLREIETLMLARHENIVHVREIVVGDTLSQVFIVMDFIEHDLKTLLAHMPEPFLASEVKTLLLQLLRALALCHSLWIVHRDLKPSNLLMNNRGQIKVADFGLARTYSDPPGTMTPLVVTLWYRAPELLLGAPQYSTAVDLWSVGCIFAELVLGQPLFPGKGEIDQLRQITTLLGRPAPERWPGLARLPGYASVDFRSAPLYSSLRQELRFMTPRGLDLLGQLLTYDPDARISAEDALQHPFFTESPLPKPSDFFSSFPSLAAGERRQVFRSPDAPRERKRGGGR